MKKNILIIFCCIFLTGCASVNYNLDIQKNLSVEEKVNISATKEYFDNFYMNLPITIVRDIYENADLLAPLKNNNYKYELKKDNYPYPSVFISKKYSNLNEYASKTIFKGQSFNEIFISSENNLITLKATDFMKYAPEDSSGGDDDRYPVSNLSINIRVPYVVKENNADKVDKSTNTYTWNIDEETLDKEINITFDKNKIYIYGKSFYISLGIIIILIIVVLIYIIKKIKKNRKNNFVD